MKKIITITLLLLLYLPEAFADNFHNFNQDPKNYNVKLQIFDKSHEIASFLVVIAQDKNKREFGLMNLKKLEQNYGMLFLFDDNSIIKMWMKNTFIPLDMIFIDENDIIINIEQNTTPLSLAVISSKKPVNKVLEINANLCKKLGIKNGQKIIYENY